MSTGNGAPSSWEDAVATVRDVGVKYMNDAMNAAAGTSGGINRTTINFPAPPLPPATPVTPAPATAPTTQPPTTTPQAKLGLSTLAKAGIAAAAIGIPGLAIGGTLLGVGGSWLYSKLTASPAATAPTVPGGKVTIGIGPDGKLFDPNAGAAK